MKLFYESRDSELFVGASYTQPFPAHVHRVVEIVYMLSGQAKLMIGQKMWTLKTGDAAFIFPAVPHAYERFTMDVQGMAVFMMPYIIEEFSKTFARMRPATPTLTGAQMGADVARTVNTLMGIAESDDHTLLKAYLHLFFAQTVPKLDLRPVESFDDQTHIDKVIRYISDHFQEDITLKSAADALGISPSHLSHIFIQQLNIGFRQYINVLRMDFAKRLLTDPALTVTDICYRCGYESQRTFNRVFITSCGMTPSRYRAVSKKAGQGAAV